MTLLIAGLLLWASAHLLTNGDSRSVTLFGSLAAWAVSEIVMINRRDQAAGKTVAFEAAAKFDALAVVVDGVVFALVGHFHMQLFGVAPIA